MNDFARVMRQATPESIRTNLDWFVRQRQKHAISFSEVAASLGVSVRTVQRYISDGKMVSTVERGYVTRKSYDRFLCEQFRAGGGSKLDSGEIRGLATSPTGIVTTGTGNQSARGRYLRFAAPVGQPAPILQTEKTI